jgi:regulatory protein
MGFLPKSAKPKAFLNEAGLYDYAVKALGRQMRSEAELRRLMAARAEPGARGASAVAAVVARLKEMRYLDDRSFAETYARLRQENEKLGQRRVRQALGQRGVAPEVVSEVIESRYGQANEEELARQYLDQKRLPKPEGPKDTARVMRRLVAAGFSTGTIYKILRQWNVPDESLAALDSAEIDEPHGE